MRIIECGLYGMATITLMSIIVIFLQECKPIPDCINCEGTGAKFVANKKEYENEIDSFIEWNCPDKEYSPLATLFFNTEGGTIRTLFKYS